MVTFLHSYSKAVFSMFLGVNNILFICSVLLELFGRLAAPWRITSFFDKYSNKKQKNTSANNIKTFSCKTLLTYILGM